jgi:hypothetical protein
MVVVEAESVAGSSMTEELRECEDMLLGSTARRKLSDFSLVVVLVLLLLLLVLVVLELLEVCGVFTAGTFSPKPTRDCCRMSPEGRGAARPFPAVPGLPPLLRLLLPLLLI